MIDRFKFRHYNKLAKSFTYYENPELQVDLNRNFKSGLVFPLAEEQGLYMGNYEELQQCTGLKDKNGKLIYEGDLLKPLGEDDDRVEVCWNDEKARFHLRIDWTDGDYWNGLYSETKKDFDYYELDDFDIENFEVIGNIYENPDLLENTD